MANCPLSASRFLPLQEVNVCPAMFKPFVQEFIIPAEPLNAADKMAGPGRYPKWARNTPSSAFFQLKQ